jgi:hypothetical protein
MGRAIRDALATDALATDAPGLAPLAARWRGQARLVVGLQPDRNLRAPIRMPPLP